MNLADLKVCAELLGAMVPLLAMWIRLERRLTKIEGRVQERYRDKRATNERFDAIERWLPKQGE